MRSKNLNLMLTLALLVIFIVVISLVGYSQISKERNFANVTLVVTVFNKSESNSYTSVNITALELLQLGNQVNTTYSKYGAFVNCINDICSNGDYYWMYYVNGEMAAVGASDYRANDWDIIEFRYGKVG